MYDRVPWAIYCYPEVAFAGHSEESAKEAGFDVVVSKHQYRGNSRAQIIGETEGLVKIIAQKQPDGTGGRILGVHMVGPWVTEQLGQGYLAVNWEATVAEVAEFIQPHPSAVGAVRRDGALAHRKEPARLMADVQMPQLGETVTEGTITRWFKKVGDEVKLDEPLFEVSTDKVDTEVPSPIAGVITEIKANEGDVVEVGAVIAVVGDAGSGAGGRPRRRRPGRAPLRRRRPRSPRRAAAAEPARAAPRRRRPPLPSPSRPRAAPRRRTGRRGRRRPAGVGAGRSEAVAAEAAPSGGGDSRLLSPVVRRLVNEHGLDPSQITGTGAGGRITREDVQDHIEQHRRQARRGRARRRGSGRTAPAAPAQAPAAAPAPAARRRRPRPPRRRPSPRPRPPRPRPRPASATRWSSSPRSAGSPATTWSCRWPPRPHAFSVVEVDYANVDRHPQRGEGGVEEEPRASSLTYLPFISRAIVDALAEFPHLNASVGEGQLIVHKYIDLGIAVDLGYQGLLVPVVRDADTKRLRALAREISRPRPTGPRPAS